MRPYNAPAPLGMPALLLMLWVLALGMVLATAGQAMADPAEHDHSADHNPAPELSSALAADPLSGNPVLAQIDAQLAALDRSEDILRKKHEVRDADLHRRLRASYKLLRAGAGETGADGQVLQRRAASRRVLARDMTELQMMAGELAAMEAARERLRAEREAAMRIALPAAGSLNRPVAKARIAKEFGDYRPDPQDDLRLRRHGVELESRPGKNVRAMEAGEVRYIGPAGGMSAVVIVDHGDFVGVYGRIAPAELAAGAKLASGDIVGEAVSELVYIEVRVDIGAGGYPVDPAPLFGR